MANSDEYNRGWQDGYAGQECGEPDEDDDGYDDYLNGYHAGRQGEYDAEADDWGKEPEDDSYLDVLNR